MENNNFIKNTENFKNYINKNDFKDNAYMISLYNLRTKFVKAFGEEKLSNNLDDFEKKIFTVNGRVLSDEDKVNLELLRVANIELEGREYADIVRERLDEISNIMALKDWNNPSVIKYIKEQILFLQIIMKLDITFLSVIDSLFNKEIAKINSVNKIKGKKSGMNNYE